ncbi:TMEM164 family acyltransferase [Haloplasma contractile]|uniref:Uncharacterized protein n=1 Tax=Haloplasma contractile SSD-17B TaxID=1033810 RepID=F7PTP4_9MOLU|nr:hypothetical protein [Haloplasma contractile]ERJ12208.1 hypothetical protein HLPCO_001735 [Haloplasma contractile SSD-17B]
MLGFGNIFYYLMFIFFMFNITVLCMYFLKNKSDVFVHRFIFIILLSGFLLHFLKLLFEPYYSNFPYSIRSATFENICAVSTLLFPWFYLTKSKCLKDYMIVIGMISGLGAVLYPFQSVGFTTITFDIVRFYYAHFILFLAPFLMLYTGYYQYSIKGIFIVPFIFYGILVLILTNELILIALGFVNGDLTTLLDPNSRNMALLFGPNNQLARYEWIYSPFVPEMFMSVPLGNNAGNAMYWPLIWMIIPSYIYIVLSGIIIDRLIYVFNRKRVILPLLSDEIPNLELSKGKII